MSEVPYELIAAINSLTKSINEIKDELSIIREIERAKIKIKEIELKSKKVI